MKINFDTLSHLRGYYGQEKVFLLFPRCIDGHIVWLEYVWKHYYYGYNGFPILQRIVKTFVKYTLVEVKEE